MADDITTTEETTEELTVPQSEIFKLSRNSLTKYSECVAFFKSKNVKVFPCAYRGQYGEGKVFDPEARGFTEYNYSHLYSRNEKSSYIIAWEEDEQNSYTLKCLLGGYYFEFYHLLKEDFYAPTTSSKTKRIVLRVDEIALTDAKKSSEDGTRTTRVIGSLVGEHGTGDEETNSLYLDCQRSGTVGETATTAYIFTGVALLDTDTAKSASEDFDAYLEPFSYSSSKKALEINWSSKTISDVVNTNTDGGAYAIRTLGADPADVSNATGDYSTAFGKGTTSSGEAAVAFGSYTKASGENSFAFGDNTEASGKNSIAFGEYTIANLDDMLVLGKYNLGNYEVASDDTQPVVVVGWGKGASNKNDIFRLESTGQIITKGDIWLEGAIWSHGSNNLLQLGAEDLNVGAGRITVYGEAASETETKNPLIFSVEDTGDTEIWGTLYVDKASELKGNVTAKGNLTLSKELAVGSYASFKGSITANAETSTGTDPLNVLTLGSTDEDCGGAITVYGMTANKKIFDVNKDGDTEIAGTLKAGNCTLGSIDMDGNFKIGTDGSVFKIIKGTSNSAELTGTLSVSSTITANGTITSTTGNVHAGGALEGESLSINEGVAGITSAGALSCHDSITLRVVATAPASDDTETDDTDTETDDTDTSTETTTETTSAATDDEPTILDILNIDSSSLTYKGPINGNTLSILDSDKAAVTLSFANNVLNATTGAFIDGMLTSKGLTIKDATSEAPVTATISATGALEVNSIKVGNLLELSADKAEINAEIAFKKGISLEDDVSITGDIDVNDITANSLVATDVVNAKYFVSTSDARKKCEIKDYDNTKSILDLNVKEFEFIGDETHKKHIGFIAQELQQLYPELVYEDSEGYLAIEESKLVYLLMKEVKELKKEIKNLKEK